MPPRFSYWTILAGGLPTSFRAAERDDLLPTLRRLQERHPDAVMRWFQRGKLWASPEEAESAFQKPAEPRGRDWRPGGVHRDPREPFKKQKRERNQARRQQRFDRKQGRPEQESPERERHQPGRPRTDPEPIGEPIGDRSTTNRPATHRSTTNRSTANRSTANRPAANRPATRRATRANRSATNRSATNRAAANRAAANRPAAN